MKSGRSCHASGLVMAGEEGPELTLTQLHRKDEGGPRSTVKLGIIRRSNKGK